MAQGTTLFLGNSPDAVFTITLAPRVYLCVGWWCWGGGVGGEEAVVVGLLKITTSWRGSVFMVTRTASSCESVPKSQWRGHQPQKSYPGGPPAWITSLDFH